MLLTEVINPFRAQYVDDGMTLPPGEVEELHQDIFLKCGQTVGQVRTAKMRIGLMILGEAGSGKTHLLARLRKQFDSSSRTAFVYVNMFGAFAGRLWKHVRSSMVNDLLRRYHSTTHGENGLLRILQAQFPKWAESVKNASKGGLLDWLIGKSKAGLLEPYLDEFAAKIPIDSGLRKVLPRVGNPQLNVLAHEWLRGERLDTDDLGKLGLPKLVVSDLDFEIQSRDVVLSLLRLAGEETTVFLAFDQVEAIQSGVSDVSTLKEFTTLATDLIALPGPRVVATCLRPNYQVKIAKAAGELYSNAQKMASDQVHFPTLTWEQARRVVLSWLDAEPSCKLARNCHSTNEYWPFEEKFLRSLHKKYQFSLTPRLLILACAQEFERILGHPIGPKPTDLDEKLASTWDDARKKYAAKYQGIQFDAALAITLPWLVEITELKWQREPPLPALKEANLVFSPAGQSAGGLGICFCNHSPGPLNHRLTPHIMRMWEKAKGQELTSLVLLRSEVEHRTGENQRRLDLIKTAGGRYVLIAQQQLAELAAYFDLLTSLNNGHLTRGDGTIIGATEFNAWAKGHLTSSVKSLLDDVFALHPLNGQAAASQTSPVKKPTPGKSASATASK